MHRLFKFFTLVALPFVSAAEPLNETRFAAPPALLDFTVNTLGGDARDLAVYYGKPMLVVNVASECGLTPQYKDLQSLHETYATKGLAVVAFPCNDFGAQEPGTHADIATFCKTRFGVTFDMMEKIQVAPGKRHPFYEKLIAGAGEPDKIRWNFEKFLIGRDGTVAKRFAPKIK
ncbi:MAG: glutathione peroxidase, partial [Kiritimatiellae bacterium]|nr:glutathione peroxidase [Kiritimatiellia bacterium]